MTDDHPGHPGHNFTTTLRLGKTRRAILDWYTVCAIVFLVSAFGGLALAYSGWLQ